MTPKVRLALVAAVSDNGVIGREGALPWRLRSDLKKFKEITQFKPVIMGSNTWDSLPRKPLPGRLNLVLSRDPRFEAEGGIVCTSLHEAMDIAREHAADDGADEICVIGGANLYAQTLPRADRLYLTRVHLIAEGEVVFPEFDLSSWRVTSETDFERGDGDDADFTLTVYDRVRVSI